MVVGNEDRDVWKIYLEKGNFDVALKYAKVPLLVLYCYEYLYACGFRQQASEIMCSLHKLTRSSVRDGTSKPPSVMHNARSPLKKWP